jgi:hypothetical protein
MFSDCSGADPGFQVRGGGHTQNNLNSANTQQTNGNDDSPPPSHSGKLHKAGGPLRHKKSKSKSRHK